MKANTDLRLIEPKTAEDVQEILSMITVVAFVGPSGTGKSTRAISVAKQHGIDYIIDDGLLIHGAQIVAGSSAKRASTKIDSVRQAIFADETRANSMRRALVEERPITLMILGTSREMLDRICKNLWLRKPGMLLRIEDVASEKERQKAKETRMTQGKHTIPVPSMEIRHDFSGYWTDPLAMLRRRFERGARDLDQPVREEERTVVRPTFSTLGSYSISDEAMAQMAEIALAKVPGVAALKQFRAYKESSGVILNLELALYYGYNAQDVLEEAQQVVCETLEHYSSINVLMAQMQAVRLVQAAPGS